jgi:uncharacterized membrane protein YeaQ/YmgE (transglycosylase-associated protein family)
LEALVFNILGWIVAGLVVGIIARLLVPGRQNLGALGTTALGIVGALAGGGVARAIWGRETTEEFATAWPGYITAILGAAILLWLGQKFSKRT